MSQKKILIIDDEFPIRYLVEHQLRRHDFEVFSAKDGPSGVRAAQALQPDLIVLDIMMPGMDGFQVCQEIRDSLEIKSTPIIFLTACMTRKHKSRAFEVGGNDYLVKPFQADELLAHIDAILRQTEPADVVEEGPELERGRVVSLFSPKGGVGTTTLAIQLSEAVVLRRGQPVVLVDLDLPFGGIAPMLNLYNRRHIVDLLCHRSEEINERLVLQYAQQHRSKLLVIPAPSQIIGQALMPATASLESILEVIVSSGYLAILDLGSTLSTMSIEAMRLSDVVYMVTSGQTVANKLHNAFVDYAGELGLETMRFLPVVNELHGSQEIVDLRRVPVARIPHATEKSRTKMWLRDQGMQKLVSVTV